MDKVRDLLLETEAFLRGHFLLSSGKHSNGYIQCARLLMDPKKAAEATGVIVDQVKDLDLDLIVGPAMGGVIPSYELARQLDLPAIFVERKDGQMELRRGFEIKKGDRILVAEDVVTTGKSCLEAIELIESYGGEVLGVTCLVDRGAKDLGYPLYSATKINLEVYEGDACPLCDAGEPIVQPGSRDIFKTK